MKVENTLLFIAALLPLLHFAAAGCNAIKLRWQVSFWISALGLCTALVGAVLLITLAPTEMPLGLISPAIASHLLAVLVAFLGLVIVRFSRNYLAGDPRPGYYCVTLHLTLAAVSIVVLTDHLLVLVGGWVGISLALNELLLLYPDRPRAVLAAHKKFLFARAAEVALFAASILLFNQHGVWQISEILSAYPRELTTSDQIAALLLALVALIKCAQLPVHGWLIQVVEAPTPVSALLHAGIINLGGYLIILFAPLMLTAAAANWLLLVVGGLTMVLASLIMATRVSIKVMLAWSTAAQMGLMLVECAFGLYELAMLHLLAHACYKAYRFLHSGSAVNDYLAKRLTLEATTINRSAIFGAAVVGAISMSVLAWISPGEPLGFRLLVLGFLGMLMIGRVSSARSPLLFSSSALAFLLLAAHLIQKHMLVGIAGSGELSNLTWHAHAFVAALVAATFGTWRWLRKAPAKPAAQRLRAWLYAGLYLDEWFTRTTLRIWPVQLPFRLRHK
ncbi:MAG: NADH-quinone oxidoreductase subunit L, partial [Gammaproteobacteria bacterium]